MGLRLREVLVQYADYSAEDMQDVASRSLKDTQLSWCARAGLPHGIRRLFGGHAKINDFSMLLYSRDAMATPVGWLKAVLTAVASGNVDPHVTWSGRWDDGFILKSFMELGVNAAGSSLDPLGCGGEPLTPGPDELSLIHI